MHDASRISGMAYRAFLRNDNLCSQLTPTIKNYVVFSMEQEKMDLRISNLHHHDHLQHSLEQEFVYHVFSAKGTSWEHRNLKL